MQLLYIKEPFVQQRNRT
ncbi:hypothetical protein Pint_10375 [Pistacia integerrima]|uniref:Uncharacterized protein n=1 Tax=Pistacia integerrima TaxID=434235 RepID=A0ACC0XIY1_9ROSI|nr:hypothetical protein Pint_10375 [Pistacia integerrima]